MKKQRRYLRRMLILVGGLVLLYFGSALVMVALPMPEMADAEVMTKEEDEADGMTIEQLYEFEPHTFVMRDGISLHCRRFVSTSPDSLVFLHGASGHSSQLNKCAGLIRESTGIEVFAYDHRGHGESPGPRGDVDYIGQYASDAADVLQAVRELKPEGRIILAGHSMGGGIVQRYAMSDEDKLADAYLLFAPVMGRGMPAEKVPPFAKPHMPRAFGLLMLNAAGIHGLDHLPVLRFGFPSFDGHINQYTYSAVRSMRPYDYRDGLTALDKPLLIVIGASDTATGVDSKIVAEEVKKHTNGDVVTVNGEGHHVQNSPLGIEAASSWVTNVLGREKKP